PWLESAPVHVLVGTREDDYHDRYRKPDKLHGDEEIDWPVPYWFVDAGAALMLLLLAAIDEGLAAGVSGVPLDAAAELRATFGIPEDVSVVALVTIGHPAPDPGWGAVTRCRTPPLRQSSTRRSMASDSPSNTASTVPSQLLRIRPATPQLCARRRTVSRKNTPCTSPWTITRRLITAARRCPRGRSRPRRDLQARGARETSPRPRASLRCR